MTPTLNVATEFVDELINMSQFVEALTYIDQFHERNGETVHLNMEKARIILMAHEPSYPIFEAERCMLRAHEIDRNNLITISLLSRYYAVVDPKPHKQNHYENLFSRILDQKKKEKAAGNPVP